jgi:hypothetical protein
MHYKTKSDYDNGLATAQMFGAGGLFRQKNSYTGQPREERVRYGHRVGPTKPAAKVEVSPELLGHIKGLTTPAALAMIIKSHWPKMYFGAVPYVDAMRTMGSFNEPYGCDSGWEIGLYFLANANTWRGEVAKAVKARMKELCQ